MWSSVSQSLFGVDNLRRLGLGFVGGGGDWSIDKKISTIEMSSRQIIVIMYYYPFPNT